MKKISFALIALLLILAACHMHVPGDQSDDRHRIRTIILTDMTHDDGNSLIRYLYYSSWFDLEAMIVTNQLPDFYHDDTGPWDKAMSILDAYRQELPKLRKHDPELPDYEELMAVTKQGRGAIPIIWLTNTLEFSDWIGDRYVTSSWDSIYFHDWIGEGLTPHGEPKDSEGSEFLVEIFEKDDDRPIFVQAWGGTVTFVQALYRYRQRHGEEKFQELLPKIHLYGILFQDITFEFFASFEKMQEKSCPWFGTAIPTYGDDPVELGMVLFDAGHFWHYCCSDDPEWEPPIYSHEVNGHGPMSDLYDDGGEGDTPAFLYPLSSVFGLNDPFDPTQGSWGSMFKPMDSSIGENYYHTCEVDLYELTRWIPAATNDFRNRLLWSVKDPEEVSSEPVAIINNDRTNNILHLSVETNETIALDASASYDPQGDELTFNWWVYPEAGTYDGDVSINNPNNSKALITIPDDAGKGETIHVICEVKNMAEYPITRYRRVVLKVK